MPFVGIENSIVAIERHLKLEGSWSRILKANSKPIWLMCRGKVNKEKWKKECEKKKWKWRKKNNWKWKWKGKVRCSWKSILKANSKPIGLNCALNGGKLYHLCSSMKFDFNQSPIVWKEGGNSRRGVEFAQSCFLKSSAAEAGTELNDPESLRRFWRPRKFRKIPKTQRKFKKMPKTHPVNWKKNSYSNASLPERRVCKTLQWAESKMLWGLGSTERGRLFTRWALPWMSGTAFRDDDAQTLQN